MKDRIRGLWIAATLLILLAGAVSLGAVQVLSESNTGTTNTGGNAGTGGSQGILTDDTTTASDRVTAADRVNAGVGCRDSNPYDSILTCEDGTDSTAISNRVTVSDTRSVSNALNVQEGEWIMLQCQLVDRTDTTLQCWPLGSDRTTVSDRTMNNRINIGQSSMGTSWSDMYDYNNPNRPTIEGSGERVQSDTTRGFESPVVYRDTLNTQRTADNADANDVVAEDSESVSRRVSTD